MTAIDTPTVGQEPFELKESDAAPDDIRHWSVTTIIGALDKPALVPWAAIETATAAVRNLDTWRSIQQSSGDQEAIDWLKGARFRGGKDQLSATELGTVVHGLAEAYALTGHRPTEADAREAVAARKKSTKATVEAETPTVMAMVGQFDRWCDEFQPSYQAAEVTVYSPRYGYAGTCDAFLTVDGIPFIADYKTSRKSTGGDGKRTGPYPEVALQLAAYRYAELAAIWRPRRFEKYRRRYYLLGQAEKEMGVPVPEVETGLVIHITPEHCDAYPVECGPEVHTAFLYVLEAARWAFQTSKNVIGPVLAPPPAPTGEAG
jgi:hypothetical protein